MFTLGDCYTREDIHALLGGSTEWYLPTVDGRVVCACLKPGANPDAPRVILPGEGEIIERTADLLVAQRSAVPCFIKRGAGRWQYVGDWVAVRCSRDPQEIAAQSRHAGRSDITRVIHMTAASSAATAE